MNADGVEVFHRADGKNVARTVAQNFKLYLLPSAYVPFDEYLRDGREHEPVMGDEAELLLVVSHAAARAAQSVSGADDYGVAAYSVGNLYALVDGIRDVGGNDGLPDFIHGLLEELPILRPVDRVDVDAYELNAVFVKETLLGELAAERETGLTAERGEETVGALLYDYSFERFDGERFKINFVREGAVSHYGCRIGVAEDDV